MTKPKYQLVIKTNQYAGNFNRELTAYVFGYDWDVQEWVKKLSKDGVAAWEAKGYDIVEDLHHFYDEHGSTICEIGGKNCSSIMVFFAVMPPAKMLDFVKQRIQEAPEKIAAVDEFTTKDIKIQRVTFGKFK